ncbi:MAG: hypothetical protein QM802_14750 [Agriterribacter sp.]
MSVISENTLLATGIILIATFNIVILIRRNRFATAQGGFHINLLFFFGFGPFAYGFAKISWDRFAAKALHQFLNKALWVIFLSYLMCTIIFFVIDYKKKVDKNILIGIINKKREINRLSGIVLVLSIIGYAVGNEEFAKSGAGTFFLVLKNLLFPALILIIYNASLKNKMSVFLLICAFGLVGINTFLSQWRSEFFIFLFSLVMGLVLRDRRYLWSGIILGPLLFVIILPFQNLKKKGEIKDSNYVDAILTSVDSKVDPVDVAIGFLAYRMNYGRESAYVLRGIDKQYISYRYGETYEELILQLIPRFVWPDKPSYNYFTGFVLPRKIGLSSKLDRYTSWGVNYFAEFMYNFPLNVLPFFFLFIWFVFRWFDNLAVRMKLAPGVKLLLQFSLFFQVLTTVSIINGATYFLWIFIIIKLINYLFYKNNSLEKIHAGTYLRRV